MIAVRVTDSTGARQTLTAYATIAPMIPEPTPEAIRRIRMNAALTQAQAAQLVHLGSTARWSEYERGVHPMDAARWELFLIKTGLSPHYRPAAGVPIPGGRARAAALRKEMKS